MKRISQDLEDILSNFALTDGSGVVPATPEMIANLRACIESSPELVDQMNKAVAEGHLKQFTLMKTDGIAGGMYDGDNKTMLLSEKSLTATPDRPFDIEDTAFVLGHETRHGLNWAERSAATAAIRKDMIRIARDPDIDSYDGPMAAWQQAARVDEASSSLSGWNVAVSQMRHAGKDVTLQSMYEEYQGRANNFVDKVTDTQGNVQRYELKDGLTLRDDMTVDINDPSNIAALGRYYYDDPQRQVGHAKAGYPNHTGATVLSQAIEYERLYKSDRMTLDFAKHGVTEEAMERNGISVSRNIRTDPEHEVIDTSHGMAVERRLHHTYDATANREWAHQHVPIEPGLAPRRRGFDDPDHPDHALYQALKERLPPGTSTDRLAQITVAASRGGVTAGYLQHVDVRDDAVFVSSQLPGDHARIDLTTPPPPQDETLQQAEQLQQQRQTQQLQWQQMEQQAQGQMMQR